MKKSSLKNAFTLLEVMIVFVILSLVISLTLYAIFSNVNVLMDKAKLNAVNSLLNAAKIQYQAENLCIGNLAFCPDFSQDNVYVEDTFKSLFYKKFKFNKICGFKSGCFPNIMYKTPSNADFLNVDADSSYYKAFLTNGMSFAFKLSKSQCNDDICAYFIIDVNGEEKPNILFKDVYPGYFTSHSVKIRTSFE